MGVKINLGTLAVGRGVDSGKFQKDIVGAVSDIRGASGKIGKIATSIGPAVAFGLGAATAAIGGVSVAVGKLVSDFSMAADDIAKSSIRAGVSVETLQEFEFAASQAGIGADTLRDAVKDMGKNSAEAARGVGGAGVARTLVDVSAALDVRITLVAFIAGAGVARRRRVFA